MLPESYYQRLRGLRMDAEGDNADDAMSPQECFDLWFEQVQTLLGLRRHPDTGKPSTARSTRA